jgi:hypothetical protein
MFKVGEKIVYVDGFSKYNKFDVLKLHKNYTVLSITATGTIRLKEHPGWTFLPRRFISLSEYRKQKIKKICSRLEIV